MNYNKKSPTPNHTKSCYNASVQTSIQTTIIGGLMLALHILNMKILTTHLLLSDSFDLFLLEEATITMANRYTIDGRIQKEFFSTQEQEDDLCKYEFAKWSAMKGFCMQIIKGKRVPLSFKFVLHLAPPQMNTLLARLQNESLAQQIKALLITIFYDGNRAIITTGYSYRSFVMEKEAEALWDAAVKKFLLQKDIPFEEL
jgi:hypothetical protein